MSLERTLSKVEQDITAGDYGKARDRLHGLSATYPNDLSLRRKLGQVYWELQHPAMAGRYWYLEAHKTPDMIAACRAFERACGSDPAQMLLAIKFRGEIGRLDGTFAGQTLRQLQQRARQEHHVVIRFGRSGAARYEYVSQRQLSRLPVQILGALGCVAIFILIIIGCGTVTHWVASLIR